jgi:hypothetical protein
MLKIRVPASVIASPRGAKQSQKISLKHLLTPEKIQKLKRIGRQVIASTVIMSILGVDMVYAMEEADIYGVMGAEQSHRSSYVPPQLLLSDKETPTPYREGQGSLPDSLADALSSSSDDGETTEEGQSSPTSSLIPSSDDGGSPGTSSPDKKNSPRSSSPTGDSSRTGDSSGEDEGGEGGQGFPPGTDIELKKMSSDSQSADEEALTEEGKMSPSEIKKQILENLNWDPSDLDNIEFAEPKKGCWGKAWDCVTSPFGTAWSYVTSPLEKAWNYVGLGFNESAEKLKETLAKKKRGYSELGEKKEPLLPDEEEGLMEKVHALAKAIKGTSLEDFAIHFKKCILDETWRWYQWLMLFPAFVMGGGTGNGMATIILASIFFNEYLLSAGQEYFDYVAALGYYITVSTAFFVFTDAGSFLTKAASPTQRFSVLKSWKEWFADWILAPLAVPQNLFIPILLWKLEQRAKEISGTTGWWNQFDEYFYFNSLGLLTYTAVSPYLRMRGAIHHSLHRDTPSYIQDRVTALDGFKERVKYNLSDPEVIELYNVLTQPYFPEHTSQFKEWLNYFIQGKISEREVVGSFLKYTYLTKRAQAEMEKEPQTSHKPKIEKIVSKLITIDSLIQAAFGLFAGFSITTGAFYDLLVDYIGWEGALATGLTIGSLTFLVSGFLQSHSFKETLEAIREEVSPYFTGKARFKETLQDPWAWGRGILKAGAYTYALGQNTLTNVAAAFGVLVFIIPPYIGNNDDKRQLAATIVIGVLSSPFFFNETVIGTKDIGGAVLTVNRNGRKIFHALTCHYFMTIRQMRLEVVRIIGELNDITLKFSREHMENLKIFEQLIEDSKERTTKVLTL